MTWLRMSRKVRRDLYCAARLLGDVNAAGFGRVAKRVERRIVGRVVGRAMGKILR